MKLKNYLPMIEKDNKALKYLHAYKDGKIKKGIGIGCLIDKHFVLKKAEFNMLLGLDNVGKTNWLLWYLLCQAKINNKKSIIWSGENRSGQLKRDIIQMWLGVKFQDIIKSKIDYYNKEISKHFKFIDNTKLYSHRDLLNIFADSDADICAIDPYTGLNHPRNIAQFERNYMICNDIREFCNKTGKTIFVCIHPMTEASRRVFPADHLLHGHIQPPRKADCEGGQVFPNRCDNFICCHRLISHKKLFYMTEIYIYKVKDKETGGEPTMMNEPLRFDYNNGLGFTIGGVNPLSIDKLDDELDIF
tara:strand:+ start:248 stop:1156 length:909 start_codon:yes stop_codon:yes gene_type:complete